MNTFAGACGFQDYNPVTENMWAESESQMFSLFARVASPLTSPAA